MSIGFGCLTPFWAIFQ